MVTGDATVMSVEPLGAADSKMARLSMPLGNGVVSQFAELVHSPEPVFQKSTAANAGVAAVVATNASNEVTRLTLRRRDPVIQA